MYRLGVRLVLACVFALAASSPAIVRASAFDVMGVGPTGVAEVNARAARADDGTAAFYNPGGLGLGHGYHLEVGAMLGASALTAQGAKLPLDDPFGATLAIDATVPLEGALRDRIRFGFAGYFLPTSAAHLITRSSAQPFFPYYDNRTQRLVAIPSLAVRIAPGLAIGAGLNLLAGVSGPASVQNGASGAPETTIDEEAKTILRANIGVRFDPTDHVRLAFTYRQRFAVRSLVTTTATIGGVPLAVNIDFRQALYDPDTFVAASSIDLGRATFEVDLAYAVWSTYDGPLTAVRAQLPGVDVSSKLPDDLFRDTFTARGAFDYRLDLGRSSTLVLRVGGGYEPSMLRGLPQGRTNFVDGGKALVGVGATLVLPDLLPKAVRIGVGASTQILAATEQTKRVCVKEPCGADTVVGPDATNPSLGIANPGYPTLSSGGSFWSMALGIGVDL